MAKNKVFDYNVDLNSTGIADKAASAIKAYLGEKLDRRPLSGVVERYTDYKGNTQSRRLANTRICVR